MDPRVCATLHVFHAITGCDTTSSLQEEANTVKTEACCAHCRCVQSDKLVAMHTPCNSVQHTSVFTLKKMHGIVEV